MYTVIDAEDVKAIPSQPVPTLAAAEILARMMTKLTGRTYKIVDQNPPAASEPEPDEK